MPLSVVEQTPIRDPPYGRVTNAVRFAMLHAVALELLDRLQSDFDVERIEPYERDAELDRFGRIPLARPTVALVPRHPGCAPVVVAFSSFPGLLVRVGQRYPLAFPGCGCDACDESAEGEADRFRRLVHAITLGHCREYLERRGDGEATLVWAWESAGQQWRELLPLKSTDASRVELGLTSRWKPWIGRRVQRRERRNGFGRDCSERCSKSNLHNFFTPVCSVESRPARP
jgi:hypothetical protein